MNNQNMNTAQTVTSIALEALPNDPLFQNQWHLLNIGQSGAKAGLDLNVSPVWQDYTGQGIKVGVFDSGIEYTHPDLADNYDLKIDYNTIALNGTVTPDGNHGTSVASVIAAVANNGIGGVGVAYDATIASYQLFGNVVEGLNQALSNNLDVLNNSWNSVIPFAMNWSNPDLTTFANAVRDHAKLGRNGLGTIIVQSAGNQRGDGSGHWANGSNFTNSPYTIAVGAVNSLGKYSNYSNQGASILVSAPANDTADPNALGIVTGDRTSFEGYNRQEITPLSSGDYTNIFGGTSAAAPMVSGVVALMLEANPDLGYRDVQEILAYTARRDVLADPDLLFDRQWEYNGATNWNGGGLHYNIDYGFGLVDATAAVRLAETWQKQSIHSNEVVKTERVRLATPIAIDGSSIISQEIVVNDAIDIEHIEVNLRTRHPNTGDLVVNLISPNGTKSTIINGANGDGEGDRYPGNKFKLSSTNFWGESSVGTWRLEIEDRNPTANNGKFAGYSLTFRGDAISDDNTYIYTNEFGNLPQDPSRQVINDTLGTDAINASAVTSDSFIDLITLEERTIPLLNLTLTNDLSTIAGKQFQIGPNTAIEKAFTGDGNDTIYGNFTNNELFGGRGNDFLVGSLGNDTLDGSAGDDLIRGDLNNANNEQLSRELTNDLLLGGTGADSLFGEVGNDTLIGGAGNDLLRGGDNADSFTFNSIDGVDTISDFIWEQGDLIVISASGFGTSLTQGLLEKNFFHNGSAANDVFDRFIYDSGTGALFFDSDGTGQQEQQQFATLSPALDLTSDNFQIIA